MSEIIRDSLGEVIELRMRDHPPRNGVWLLDATNVNECIDLINEMTGGDKDEVNPFHGFRPEASTEGFTLMHMKSGKAVSLLSASWHFNDVTVGLEVDLIFTDADHRGQGAAMQLVEELLEIYQEMAERVAKYDPEHLEILDYEILGEFNDLSSGMRDEMSRRVALLVEVLSEKSSALAYG